MTKVDAALTVNAAVATVTANAKSKTYGDANPALDAVVTGGSNGDTLELHPGDDGAEDSGRRQLPDHRDARTQPELHGDQGRRHADGQPGGWRR